MSIIYCGDIQIQNKEPYKSSCLSFLTWLLENYKDDIILQGGDLFDKSSMNHDIVDNVIEIITKFKDFRIISGNHEISDKMGNILKPLRHHRNIKIYYEKTEFEIEGIKFIALPSLNHHEKEYGNIQGSWDYSLCHFEPIQESFNNSGIELKFKATHLFSHIHRYREFIDNFKNKVLIAGSVINYRYGEQDWEKNIYKITKEKYEKIKVPFYFTYETLEYGQMPSNKNNILHIKNVPSWEALYKIYKEYNIREEGIEFIKTENDIKLDSTEFESSDLKQKFSIFAVDKGLTKEVSDLCFQYIDKYDGMEVIE